MANNDGPSGIAMNPFRIFSGQHMVFYLGMMVKVNHHVFIQSVKCLINKGIQSIARQRRCLNGHGDQRQRNQKDAGKDELEPAKHPTIGESFSKTNQARKIIKRIR